MNVASFVIIGLLLLCCRGLMTHTSSSKHQVDHHKTQKPHERGVQWPPGCHGQCGASTTPTARCRRHLHRDGYLPSAAVGPDAQRRGVVASL